MLEADPLVETEGNTPVLMGRLKEGPPPPAAPMETGRCKAEPGGTPPPAVAMETGRCKAEPGGTPPPAVAMETGRCKAEAGGPPPPAVAMKTGRCKAEPGGTPPPAVVETVETKFTSDEKKSLFPGDLLASFPGPAQLSVAISTVKRERAWYLFSRE